MVDAGLLSSSIALFILGAYFDVSFIVCLAAVCITAYAIQYAPWLGSPTRQGGRALYTGILISFTFFAVMSILYLVAFPEEGVYLQIPVMVLLWWAVYRAAYQLAYVVRGHARYLNHLRPAFLNDH